MEKRGQIIFFLLIFIGFFDLTSQVPDSLYFKLNAELFPQSVETVHLYSIMERCDNCKLDSLIQIRAIQPNYKKVIFLLDKIFVELCELEDVQTLMDIYDKHLSYFEKEFEELYRDNDSYKISSLSPFFKNQYRVLIMFENLFHAYVQCNPDKSNFYESYKTSIRANYTAVKNRDYKSYIDLKRNFISNFAKDEHNVAVDFNYLHKAEPSLILNGIFEDIDSMVWDSTDNTEAYNMKVYLLNVSKHLITSTNSQKLERIYLKNFENWADNHKIHYILSTVSLSNHRLIDKLLKHLLYNEIDEGGHFDNNYLLRQLYFSVKEKDYLKKAILDESQKSMTKEENNALLCLEMFFHEDVFNHLFENLFEEGTSQNNKDSIIKILRYQNMSLLKFKDMNIDRSFFIRSLGYLK